MQGPIARNKDLKIYKELIENLGKRCLKNDIFFVNFIRQLLI